MPPWIGLFFVAIKPQIGAGVVVFWVVQAWRRGGWREMMNTFAPIAVVTVVSLFIFGFWPSRFSNAEYRWWNARLWPASIPVGLALLVAALRKNRIQFAMGASPRLSPYVLLHSWVGALLAIIHSLPKTVAAVVGLWIVVLIQAF